MEEGAGRGGEEHWSGGGACCMGADPNPNRVKLEEGGRGGRSGGRRRQAEAGGATC